MKKGKLKKQVQKKTEISEELVKRAQEELAKEKIPKVLIHGVAPFIKNSKGVICNYLGEKFLNLGIPTVLAAYSGVEPGGFFRFGNLTVLPVEKNENDPYGLFSTIQHFIKFRLDVIVTFTPFWKITELAQFPTIVVASIDALDYPQQYIEELKRFKYIVAPTMFAEKELKKYGIESVYIPLGVNTKSFMEYPKIENRKLFNIGENDFCIGIVASNKSKEPKKGWDSSFEAISIFFKEHPEVREKTKILIHSQRKNKEGLDLEELAKQFGIDDRIIWQDQHLILLGLPEGTLARLYSTIDVLLNLSRYEDTNLAVLEAAACGTPSIVTDFGVMKERVNFGKCGYLVPVKSYIPNEIGARVAIPDVEEAAKVLWRAYSETKEREHLGKKAKEFVQNYSWEIITVQKWLPYLKKIGEEIIKESVPVESTDKA